MENVWSDSITGERKDLAPIMEEEDRGQAKGSQSDSSDAASTIKRWNSRWTPSEGYDSSGTSTNSDVGDEYVEDYRRDSRTNLSEPAVACQAAYRSQECLCQACLLGYAKMIALQGSMPNICAVSGGMANICPASTAHLGSFPSLCACSSVSSELAHHAGFKEHARSVAHYPHVCHLQQDPMFAKEREVHAGSRTNSTASLPVSSAGRCGGSLDRRRRRFRSRVDRDQRAMSHSDLICHENSRPQHYCSLQQFHCGSNVCINNYHSKTEERLRKLESERGALHMEVSVLSEQVDAQSNKIQELESLLQEKKDTLRQMEEALQKEVLSRSALETQKLELLTSLSEMKLRQASLEHENLSLRSTSPLSNGERFSRHTGQYSSLPRPPTSKKGVVFGKVPNLVSGVHTTVPLAVRGVSARCLSAPILAEEAKIVIGEASVQVEVPPKPLAELSMEEIGDWLSHLGLECYAGELRRWGATGLKLLDATQVQLEKELDIKNALHRKKLLYAVESERSNGAGFLGSQQMDNAAVLRWLDDVGLPQHKEAFHHAKIDGRVLHRLTTEDLLNLGVTAQLHAASLRRGIQVLRDLNFEFDCLERRSVNGNGADGTNVTLWTNHRVMEWLRVVDLAEYAPNMRGSGVHGGLMIHEGRFTSELLATLLSIPPAKTLLRRHLTTHFNQILGRDVVQQKREIESTLGFVPLTLTARLKVPKKSQFTLKRKKSKNEMDFGNLVCPLEASPPDLEDTGQRRVIGCI
ncbi:PREDICTED: liprin-beta-2 isoform X2 [Wasmannia auropunctata]|uniref:liprin-beta-2 isoform X2 n=1 Tax=Wasmannia auropunctata TaxID=64793 RepID=UPI0005ED9884|nr:PREDICTED: liprin-beta-2 isoform X2 [Wasmannia auropunctata]